MLVHWIDVSDTLVDLVNLIFNAAGVDLQAIKDGVFVEGVKDGISFIGENVFIPILDGIVDLLSKMLHILSEVSNAFLIPNVKDNPENVAIGNNFQLNAAFTMSVLINLIGVGVSAVGNKKGILLSGAINFYLFLNNLIIGGIYRVVGIIQGVDFSLH